MSEPTARGAATPATLDPSAGGTSAATGHDAPGTSTGVPDAPGPASGLTRALGLMLALLGAALLWVGWQRKRFGRGGGGPGIVLVDERRLTYWGPLSGGTADMDDLRRLDLDATGDPAKNEELAKQRALAVSAALKAAGIADDKVDLKKPEAMTGGGSSAEARRVEVALQ